MEKERKGGVRKRGEEDETPNKRLEKSRDGNRRRKVGGEGGGKTREREVGGAGRRGRQMEGARGEGEGKGGGHEPRGILSAVIHLSLSRSLALARHSTRPCGSVQEGCAALPPPQRTRSSRAMNVQKVICVR